MQPADAHQLGGEQQRAVVIVENHFGVEGEMGRDVPGGDNGGHWQVLIIIQDRQAAPDSGEHEGQDDQPGPLQRRQGDARQPEWVFAPQRQGHNQAAHENQRGGQPEGRRDGDETPQQVRQPVLQCQPYGKAHQRLLVRAQVERPAHHPNATQRPEHGPGQDGEQVTQVIEDQAHAVIPPDDRQDIGMFARRRRANIPISCLSTNIAGIPALLSAAISFSVSATARRP